MPDFSMMRWQVDHAAKHHSPEVEMRRPCPVCGAALALCSGRNSENFFWSHLVLGPCREGGIGMKVMFRTREEAVTAGVIWKVRPPTQEPMGNSPHTQDPATGPA